MPKPLRLLAVAALACAASALAAEPALPEDLHAALNPPAVPGVEVSRITAAGAELSWPASLAATDAFRFEARHFSLGEDRELRMDWVDYDGVSVSRQGDRFRARLRGLAPRQPYWIRVLPRGAAAEPLFVVRFDTPARAPIFTPRRIAIGALAAVLAVLLWLRWRR